MSLHIDLNINNSKAKMFLKMDDDALIIKTGVKMNINYI